MILTFFLLSLLVLFLDDWTGGWTTMHLFCVYRSSLKDPLFYIRLFGHVLGHAGWEHFLNNMLLLLVVGPPMEEKYGSKALLGGIVFTALVTGVLQCVLFPRTGLLGASGIVFMLIMLSSLAGFSVHGEPIFICGRVETHHAEGFRRVPWQSALLGKFVSEIAALLVEFLCHGQRAA